MLQELVYYLGPSAILLFVLWLARKLIETRLVQSVQHEFNSKLESLRSDLGRRATEIATLQSSLLSVLAQGQSRLDERRLLASERLWIQFLRLRASSGIVRMFAYLKVDGMVSQRDQSNYDAMLDAIFPGVVLDQEPRDAFRAAEQERPFLDDMAWALFGAYHGIVIHDYARLTTLRAKLDPAEFVLTDRVTRELQQVMPEMHDYLDRVGAAGFAQLLDPLEVHLLQVVRHGFSGDAREGTDARLMHRMSTATMGLSDLMESSRSRIPPALQATPAPAPEPAAPQR